MEKVLRVFGLIVLTLLFLVLFVNIFYWGLILVGGFIGVRAYVVIGIILLALIAGYVIVFKSLMKKTSAPNKGTV